MFKIKGTRKLEKFMIISIIFLLLLFSSITESIGYTLFTRYYSKEYSDSAYKVGLTAQALINANNIDKYLEKKGEDEEYKLSYQRLEILTNKMDVSVIYVIKPDNDYKHYTNIYNVVNTNSGYSAWEIGSRKKTTNRIYEKKFKQLMEENVEKTTVFRTKELKGAKPHLTSLIPLKNNKGKVTGILCIQRFMGDLTKARKKYALSVFSITITLIIITIAITKNFIGKHVVEPVIAINKETNRFANEEIKTIGNLQHISIISEIESMSNSINKIENDMIKYIANLTEVTKEKERISTELKLANLIQTNSIPNDFPAFSKRKDFDLYALMEPAKEVGGDFYDFFLIDENHICLVMADVSGKGIPAALFMMVTKILVNEISHTHQNPAEILNLVNDRICSNNKTNMFITIWLGILDLRTGEMNATNAGHEEPAIYRNNQKFEIKKQKHGIPVGAMENYKYNNYKIKLNPGDKLFIYTDGVPEAENNKNEMFGLERMLDTLNKFKKSNCKEILTGVKDAVDLFEDNAIQFDDLTMLCFEYIGNAKENKIMKKEIFKANSKNLDDVISFIHSATKGKIDNKLTMKLEVVVEEIFVNISKYAYETTGNVEIQVITDKNKIIITFIDEGKPFNPLDKKDPDISLTSEERQIGGLGIFMIKKIMDKVDYEYKNNKNHLTIEKNIKGD